MASFFHSLTNDTILSLISTVLGLFGIVLAVVFYIKGKKNKQPYYLIKSFNIIYDNFENKIKNIEILYKKQIIKNLTISKIVIWNNGNEAISRSDIPDATKFTIETKEGVKIYDIEFIANTDTANKLAILNQDQQYLIDFDFIDPNQGFIIKVTHSGKNSDDVLITGRVKGGFVLKPKVGYDSSQNELFTKISRRINDLIISPSFLKYFSLLFGLACFAFSIAADKLSVSLRIGAGILGGIYVLAGIIWISEKNVPKTISKTFEDE